MIAIDPDHKNHFRGDFNREILILLNLDTIISPHNEESANSDRAMTSDSGEVGKDPEVQALREAYHCSSQEFMLHSQLWVTSSVIMPQVSPECAAIMVGFFFGCKNAVEEQFIELKPQLVMPSLKVEEPLLFYNEAFRAEDASQVSCPKHKVDQELLCLICAEIKIGGFQREDKGWWG